MVKVKELEAAKFEILLKPNSSLTGSMRIFFLGSIFFICSIIGVGFFLAGGVMILPFAGLEIILVYLAFRLSFNWSSQKQIIILSKDHVEVRVDGLKEFFTWKEFRSFATFNVTKNNNKNHDLSFRSKGKEVIVGSFLNEDDKSILRDEISKIIQKLNALGFAN
tara:strand:- start:1185 stop:1676 length:492 start_codon:yes stop_codon:yes gene_type:complete